MPCKQTHCLCKAREKQYCRNWEPSKGHRYTKCSKFINARATCDLPNEACATCPFFLGNAQRGDAKINWRDPEAVKQHRNEYMKMYKKRRRLERDLLRGS